MRVRRIDREISLFLENRRRPFTISDLMKSVKWEGSAKHLARFLIKNPFVKSIGKKREEGKKLNLYQRVDSTNSGSASLYGLQ